jgi:hypothetical protein
MRRIFFVALEVTAAVIVIKWAVDEVNRKNKYQTKDKRDPLELKGLVRMVASVLDPIIGNCK